MHELARVLLDAEVDKIADDQEFVKTENDLVREYCIQNKFNLSEEDLLEISNRGLDDALEFWKNEFKDEII